MPQVKTGNVDSLSALLPKKEIFSKRKELLKESKTLDFSKARKGYCFTPGNSYIS